MKLVGIDLSADPKKTGVCVLEDDAVVDVHRGSKTVGHPGWLVGHCARADIVAVDVPFGWPKPFVEALTGYEIGVALAHYRKRYLRRMTDAFVAETLPQRLPRKGRSPNPFAVAADKLGVTATVGTVLLNALSDQFRLSSRESYMRPAMIEVYPAASLWAWGLHHRNVETSAILERLLKALNPTILEVEREKLLGSRHCFDALIAALTAREYADGNTFDPPEHVPNDILRIEGWIRVPNRAVKW